MTSALSRDNLKLIYNIIKTLKQKKKNLVFLYTRQLLYRKQQMMVLTIDNVTLEPKLLELAQNSPFYRQ